MRYTPRKHLPHEVPSWVKNGELYFFTLCAQKRAQVDLTEPKIGRCLLDAARYYHKQHRWRARLFLLMPDHLHALISFPSNEVIRKCWRDWKRYTAKQTFVEWQRDILEHRIRSDESWEEKAFYIRQNPVRQKLVKNANLWSWVFET
jgi:REP element-mobilizing transposase RayT